MFERLEFLRDKANRLPLCPGVYRMKDRSGAIIYIGKAKLLKNRVTSYFHAVEAHNAKTYKLVSNIDDFDFIVTETELDALVLEASLIKLHTPKYNILLKDDKGFSYIRITGGDYPRIEHSFKTDDPASTYIGPYMSGYTVKQTIEECNKIFMLPTCKKVFPRDFGKERPCLNHHIKRCMGVCLGRMSPEEYRAVLDQALGYLKNGGRESVERLTKEMEAAAEALDFERAASIRDRIRAIERAAKTQSIQSGSNVTCDVFAVSQNQKLTSVAVVKYRKGKLIDKENYFIGDEYDEALMRSEFLLQYYGNGREIPKSILLDGETEDNALLEEYFRGLTGHKVALSVPKRGEGLVLTTLAKSNADEYLSIRVGRTSREITALQDLAKLLGLPKTPFLIESYDISNLGEQTRVAGMITYKNGRPYKAGYRRFNIKEVVGIDDYACMQEVLRRRFTRYLEGDEGFSDLPDLILLDGGAGHVNAVRAVLDELGLKVSLFGLVKDEKHRTRAISDGGAEIGISANRSLFKLLTEIQDEVHRYSIDYQRKKHKQTQYELELTRVRGIGEKKALALLKKYKTKQAIREATPEELMETAKVGRETAEELYLYIQEIF
ncbi:MAG: excinuclease ABC subunit UvrC [Bacteroides sp.]|nr:excinuclease ABC subunit UvrC [Eubacterium sp.]MCM1417959.1 excinuclease ABC subunit UvrC [Roseburia sp.]MCM1461794.1 excinuclease ABC subunit UvrC [Bacteroides sp.]